MKKNILIVEDEPIIAADLQDRLEDAGYGVLASVGTGERALEEVRKQLPDLILMDVHLAGALDGVDTALAIRRLADIPLIFLTSNSDKATFSRAREARPRAFLSKPFRGRDLAHAIDLAIGLGDPAPENRTLYPAHRRPKELTDAAPHKSEPGSAPVELPEGEAAMLLNDRLWIKVKERLTRLMLSEILWLEADDYYCRIVTDERNYLITKTLKKVSALLPEDTFMRCHRSYVVNLKRVTEIGEIYVFVGKKHVPVSRSKRGELLSRIQQS